MAAHQALSERQFQQRAEVLNAGGGFSTKAFGPRAGDEARDAVMVGGAGGAPEGKIPTPSSGGDIKAYATEHQAALSPEHRYLGGWNDTLDVSDAFPRSAAGTTMAVIQGIARGEDSVGAVGHDAQFAGEYPTNAGMANPATTKYQVPSNRERHGPRS